MAESVPARQVPALYGGIGARHGRAIVAFCAAAAVLTLWFCWLDNAAFLRGELSRGQIAGRDFQAFWVASGLAAEARFDEIFRPDRFNQALRAVFGADTALNAFPYPPHGLWLVLPLAWLPYGWSLALWAALSFLAYLAATAAPAWPAARLAGLIAAPSTALTLSFGQNGLLSAALMVGGLRLLDRHPVVAGVLFGILSYKPHLGLLIPVALLAGRHRTAFFSAAATVAALAAVSLAWQGPESWQTYADAMMPHQRAFIERWTGMFTMMVPTAFMSARLLGLGPDIGYLAQVPFSAAALAAVAWSFRRDVSRPLRNATLLTATFLMSPYLCNYDMTIVSVAVILTVEQSMRSGFLNGERLILGAAWLLPLAVMPLNAVGAPAGPIVLTALLGLLIAKQRRLDRRFQTIA